MPESLLSDLRSLGIGIIAGIASFYATRAIDRYMAGLTARSRNRRIEEARAELKLIQSLGSSDRALLLFGLRFLFAFLALISLAMGAPSLLALVRGSSDFAIVNSLIWATVGVLSVYACTVLRKLEDPQPTLDELQERIRKLEAQNNHKTGA